MAASDFEVRLLTPGPISDAAWDAGAYEGLMRIRDSVGAQAAHVETKTRPELEEALRDFAAHGYWLVFGHGAEFEYAAARDSIVPLSLRVPRVESVPDSPLVTRP